MRLITVEYLVEDLGDYRLDDKEIRVRLMREIPNQMRILIEDEDGAGVDAAHVSLSQVDIVGT